MLAGAARDAGDRGDMRLYAPLPNKRLDAAWSFGGSAGAMDSGTAQNDTWYHVHLIKRSDVGSVDALLSTSPESPVLPANFDRFRRLGGVLTDTSTTLIDFTAYALSGGGQRTVWKERALDLDTTVASDGGTLVAMSVPTGPSVLAYGDIFLSNASTHRELITGPDDDDVAADDAHQTVRVQTGETANVVARWSAMVNSAAQIRHRGSGGGAVNGLKITTIGWEDGRRP
jgi:hypothetical protein